MWRYLGYSHSVLKHMFYFLFRWEMAIIKVVLFTKKGISTEKHVSEVSECMKNNS